MAQVYNHIIMPLASERDRLTQIRSEVADYEFALRHQARRHVACGNRRRTQRNPRSMTLTQEGIRFTVLAPHQCKRIRALNADSRLVGHDRKASVDTTRPYHISDLNPAYPSPSSSITAPSSAL